MKQQTKRQLVIDWAKTQTKLVRAAECAENGDKWAYAYILDDYDLAHQKNDSQYSPSEDCADHSTEFWADQQYGD